jgi:hypothetical protein
MAIDHDFQQQRFILGLGKPGHHDRDKEKKAKQA